MFVFEGGSKVNSSQKSKSDVELLRLDRARPGRIQHCPAVRDPTKTTLKPQAAPSRTSTTTTEDSSATFDTDMASVALGTPALIVCNGGARSGSAYLSFLVRSTIVNPHKSWTLVSNVSSSSALPVFSLLSSSLFPLYLSPSLSLSFSPLSLSLFLSLSRSLFNSISLPLSLPLFLSSFSLSLSLSLSFTLSLFLSLDLSRSILLPFSSSRSLSYIWPILRTSKLNVPWHTTHNRIMSASVWWIPWKFRLQWYGKWKQLPIASVDSSHVHI